MGLNDPRNSVSEGVARFDGVDLLRTEPETLREIRGKRISMIFQDPMTSLNPVKKIGWQLEEAVLSIATSRRRRRAPSPSRR